MADETDDESGNLEESEEPVIDEETEDETPAEAPLLKGECIKRLKPDPEDELQHTEAVASGEETWIEQAFDPEYEQPRLTPSLAKFIRKGYDKLGRKLGQYLMAEGLSMVAKTISGLSHAYVKLDLPGRSITDIALVKSFCNLRYVSLAGNHIFDILPLNQLQFLISLDLSDNYLESLEGFELHNYLKVLNVSKNFLKHLDGVVEHPYLQRLYLSYNKLAHFAPSSPRYLRELEVLELRKNRLIGFGGPSVKFPALKVLFIAQNNIEKLENLRGMKSIEFLDVRRNKLKSLADWPTLPNLKHLNVSFNFLEDVAELEKLAVKLARLKVLVIKNNPIMKDEIIGSKMIVAYTALTRVNDVRITKEKRQEAITEVQENAEEDGA
ncbi:hypothetical protein RvY_07551 [Ramazzottius varieornatus]|uniref:Leucine-rich repeat-containing protein 23 n=1 Tax=Ramazzottius varieornatus TaxID=947166 RepID=A0A1D1V564_RAMVA|nr:hypothetical protein RvY_07551 [Ramazzottius varieornatus]